MIDYTAIEKKWQEEWANAKVFEAEPNDKPGYMVTAAFPYANTPQHIGHIRSYGTADMLARYKRMRGYNVLYPMAFHATGTPVLAIAKRLKNNDDDLIHELHDLFHISKEDIEKMTDPVFIVEYMMKEQEQGMIRQGLGIDWRRKFRSIDPIFSKFVEWQFAILNAKGFLVQGKHPLGWCPNENNAVGMHDTKGDVEPEIAEEIAIKFKVEGEDASIICTTYRPETIFGVTNIFVNKNVPYVLCDVEGSKYYMSKAASSVLSFQLQINIIQEVSAEQMLSKKCRNPKTNEVIPVLPGFFVKDAIGTGAVMSVPAHAPFDYSAIERLRNEGVDVSSIKPKKLIEVKIGRSLSDVSAGEAKPVHVDMPALAYLEVLHADANAIDEMLEFATKLQYREESHWGTMLVEEFKGMSEPAAREKIKAQLVSSKDALKMYVIQNAPIKCRCKENVVVKIVDNQWFLNYGNAEWKELTKRAFEKMQVKPEKLRNTLLTAINWIDLRAVARAQGLGTKFPIDKNFIIESLSDSTIYMSFYTISHLIRDIEPEKLKPEFFDFVMLGKGDANKVSESTGIDFELVKKCRESFEYWYRETSRHSGSDLVFNHLTMYIFNHVAVFGEEYWPKQMVVNGLVLYEGEKMSKSMGNIVPLVDGLKIASADALRTVIITSSDLFSDSEYSAAAINGIKERFEFLNDLVNKIADFQSGELKHIDYWLYSKLNYKIKRATEKMEDLEVRDVATDVLYNSVIELRHYMERGGSNGIVIKDYLQNLALLLHPVAPHISEELWHNLGNATLAVTERWPTCDESMINGKLDKEEEMINSLVSDIRKVKELALKKNAANAIGNATIVIAAEWKRRAQTELANANGNMGEAIKALGEAVNPSIASAYLSKLAKSTGKVYAMEVEEDDEYKVISESLEYLKNAVGIEVSTEKEEESKSERAARAVPLKPSIEIS